MMTEKKECKPYGEVSVMLQIAIVEDEEDLAQQTKDNVVRYLNEHGLEVLLRKSENRMRLSL